ncbi:MAG: hypothetical protein CSA55_00385 [Ilumatobacter coccineus]|uniref:beta-mannosidase n=1 Tax=Ilumatobacter coccineus TaxID=467094 RepID=A0A2G6KIN0_9ACTN|nr:MAG: hypothetical protein CSA55_00385 [Ilumatobacter coccineus]
MDLSGQWRATPATDDHRRRSLTLDADDQSWIPVVVPGHWRDLPAFATSDGPILYRCRYQLDPPADGRRRWVIADGIMYQADLWLDGAYLGDTEGFFVHHRFDITALSRLGDDHVLAVEVASPPPHHPRHTITGTTHDLDGHDPAWNPGGIWRPIRIIDTGPVRIDGFKVLCRDADDVRAHLVVSLRLDCERSHTITVHIRVDGEVVDTTDHRVAGGSNEITTSFDVFDPQLWWPRSLGDQPLTTVEVEVEVDGVISDRAERRTGLRVVAWNNWTCSVNGERIFLKGANLLPSRLSLASASADDLRREIDLAIDAGLDALRIHGHIAPDPIYDAADEAGLLLLQDFPLHGIAGRSIRSQAITQADAMVWQLAHHPSIIEWSAHNEPFDPSVRRSPLRWAATHQVPTWNSSILDRWVRRTIENADPTRLASPHSGVLPHLPRLDGTDTHLYIGWHHGDLDDLGRITLAMPRIARFVSEFGAQSIPDTSTAIDPTAWPDLDWNRIERTYRLDRAAIERHVPPTDYATYDDWRAATEAYQSELIRRSIEHYRRLKYHPTGGFCLYSLNDPGTIPLSSVVDHDRQPKRAWSALVAACQDVIVVATPLPSFVTAGDTISTVIHLVNDQRHAIEDAVVTATATWPGGSQTWRFTGRALADSVTRVGQLTCDLPNKLGQLAIDLTATFDGRTITNRYTSALTIPPDD